VKINGKHLNVISDSKITISIILEVKAKKLNLRVLLAKARKLSAFRKLLEVISKIEALIQIEDVNMLVELFMIAQVKIRSY